MRVMRSLMSAFMGEYRLTHNGVEPNKRGHRLTIGISLMCDMTPWRVRANGENALMHQTVSMNRRARAALLGAGVWFACVAAAQTDPADYALQVDVRQQGQTFVTQASFRLPLSMCQAWRFITDYDSATQIPGIVESRSQRLSERTARVERVMQDRILLFPIRMRTVIDYTEQPGQGTDFVQVEGETRSYRGSWRLEPDGAATVFRYQAVSEPDSALPMGVIRYFINNRLRSSFAAMAQVGAARRQQPCS